MFFYFFFFLVVDCKSKRKTPRLLTLQALMCSHVDSMSDCISTGCDGLVPVVRDIMWKLQSNTFYWQKRRETYIKRAELHLTCWSAFFEFNHCFWPSTSKHPHEERIDNR